MASSLSNTLKNYFLSDRHLLNDFARDGSPYNFPKWAKTKGIDFLKIESGATHRVYSFQKGDEVVMFKFDIVTDSYESDAEVQSVTEVVAKQVTAWEYTTVE